MQNKAGKNASNQTAGQAAYYTTAELAERGLKNLPPELVSNTHLIYSSPAALAFNSPGAEGFGVKRAALSIPGSVMLLVSPGCCGRNTSLISRIQGYANRFFYLTMSETDIITGRHLKKIPQAIEEIYNSLEQKPSIFMICITCVDALLGTDMERVCRKAEERVPVPVRPSYMYALTREGRKPPMVHVRQSLYSVLQPMKKKSTSVNILGHFAPLENDCELYDLLRGIGIRQIREISRCENYEEFMKMAEANFNIVLNPEARFAAEDFEKNLKIPFIEMRRFYDIDRIHRQYMAFLASIGLAGKASDQDWLEETKAVIRSFKQKHGGLTFSIGECVNADPFELAAALIRYNFSVSEIFGTVTADNFFFVQKLAETSPQTRIYSNLEPTMIAYRPEENPCDVTIGKDAGYYHPDKPNLTWNSDIQPFGYAGVREFFRNLAAVLESDQTEETKTASYSQAGPQALTDASPSYSKTAQFSLLEEKKIPQGPKNNNFRKYLTPFAPDQSGAVGVLFELGGIQVICDAGGCVGNICGFDEPRWFEKKSAIFSAGLRDMDAILGRDDKLVEKLADAAGNIQAEFAAVIGTPVPSVIATDYHALKRMAEKKTAFPILTVDTNGMELYDEGEKKAYLELFSTFTQKRTDAGEVISQKNFPESGITKTDTSEENRPVNFGKMVGVIGVTPLNYSDTHASDKIKAVLAEQGWKQICTYGMDCGLEHIAQAPKAELNLVAAPSGLAAAEFLQRRFGTPYRFCDPLAKETLHSIWPRVYEESKGKKILIVSQQVTGADMRKLLKEYGAEEITLATWFMKLPQLARPQDLRLTGEKQFMELVENGDFDVVISDATLWQMIPDYQGLKIDLPQFAVSGRLMEDCL